MGHNQHHREKTRHVRTSFSAVSAGLQPPRSAFTAKLRCGFVDKDVDCLHRGGNEPLPGVPPTKCLLPAKIPPSGTAKSIIRGATPASDVGLDDTTSSESDALPDPRVAHPMLKVRSTRGIRQHVTDCCAAERGAPVGDSGVPGLCAHSTCYRRTASCAVEPCGVAGRTPRHPKADGK